MPLLPMRRKVRLLRSVGQAPGRSHREETPIFASPAPHLGRLAPRADAEFGQDRRDVVVDGLVGDVQGQQCRLAPRCALSAVDHPRIPALAQQIRSNRQCAADPVVKRGSHPGHNRRGRLPVDPPIGLPPTPRSRRPLAWPISSSMTREGMAASSRGDGPSALVAKTCSGSKRGLGAPTSRTGLVEERANSWKTPGQQ
jgi:hypothetical protein